MFSLAVAALALLSLSPVTAGASIVQRHGPKPTIVLVHGAWADPSGWQQVVDRLHKDGYATVTPTLDLLSIEGDAAIVRAALDAIAGDKILVGHSYGGVVVSNASYGRSDIRAIVYTAAFVPEEGESALSLLEGYAPSAALDHLVFTGEAWNSPAFIDPAFFHEIFAADLSDDAAAAMNAAQRPTHPAAFVSPSGPVGWHDVPLYYAVSGQDLIIDPHLERWMAERAGATTIEFKQDSHVGGFIVHAHQFTKLIERAARETGC
jgi:pimeloyl-ACP methyl ester carboxylesterase